jgi:hypothetical protein
MFDILSPAVFLASALSSALFESSRGPAGAGAGPDMAHCTRAWQVGKKLFFSSMANSDLIFY